MAAVDINPAAIVVDSTQVTLGTLSLTCQSHSANETRSVTDIAINRTNSAHTTHRGSPVDDSGEMTLVVDVGTYAAADLYALLRTETTLKIAAAVDINGTAADAEVSIEVYVRQIEANTVEGDPSGRVLTYTITLQPTNRRGTTATA